MLVKIVDTEYILRAIKCGFDVRQASDLFTLENRVYYFDQDLKDLLPEIPRDVYLGDHCIVLDLDRIERTEEGEIDICNLLGSLKCLKIIPKTRDIFKEVDYEDRTDAIRDQ